LDSFLAGTDPGRQQEVKEQEEDMGVMHAAPETTRFGQKQTRKRRASSATCAAQADVQVSWSLSGLPKSPFSQVVADEAQFLRCFECLVGYFRGRKLGNEAPEDSAQQVLMSAWEIMPNNTQHYVARVAFNHFITRLREQNRRPRHQAIFFDQITSPREPVASLENERLKERLLESLSQLPQQLGVVVELYFFGGMTQVAIAEQLRISANTDRNRLKRAYKCLREELEPLIE